MLRLHEQVDRIQGPDDLANFILALRSDLLENPEKWEQDTLESYLESIAAWLVDTKPKGPNVEQTEPLSADAWRMIGEVLYMGRIYE